MGRTAIKLTLAGFMLAMSPWFASAAPVNGAGLLGAVDQNPLVHDARLVCVNRYSGRIMYYGPCRRRVVVRRFYCRNRYTGRFLYWGRCR